MNTLLFVTDLYYEAKGRNYYEEVCSLLRSLEKILSWAFVILKTLKRLKKILT
ncbi:hypothetical protein ACIROD_16875 [Peribacillus sp. NPDC101481]|jgi:hypothetical protein|uniref:hypothetical protein n=1 Tax=Peribacillus TaxID=2675229 RepID=UPI0021A9E454|nr:hypothetical protein [Peribacillus frigoritolerans]MCT4477325.1 hypothetical protein [Peribacillus frigoritolerans]